MPLISLKKRRQDCWHKKAMKKVAIPITLSLFAVQSTGFLLRIPPSNKPEHSALRFSTPSTSVRVSDLNAEDVAHFAKQWQQQWKSSQDDVTDSTGSFLLDARERLGGRLYVAKEANTDRIVGTIACQVWSGAVPIEVVGSALQLGAVWGLSGQPNVARVLIARANEHLRQIGCHKALMVGDDFSDLQSFRDCGYESKNMLSTTVGTKTGRTGRTTTRKFAKNVRVQAEGPQIDDIVCDHWRRMWTEAGIEIPSADNLFRITSSFIQEARSGLQYQTFAAVQDNNGVVGSLSCQILRGTFPRPADCRPYGTIWATYVKPQYRRMGIATALMQQAIQHLTAVGCQKIVLVAASTAGQRVYERLGFSADQCLVRDLSNNNNNNNLLLLRDHLTIHGVDAHNRRFGPKALTALATATTRQLHAAFANGEDDEDDQQLANNNSIFRAVQQYQQAIIGTYVDPDWLQSQLPRMGRGFDATSSKDVLVQKFDRLADKYDQWTVGNGSKVEYYIARWARGRLLGASTTTTTKYILDVAAGIGLQGQLLRLLLGCRDDAEEDQLVLVGTDLSPRMVQVMQDRQCYDAVLVADATSADFGEQLMMSNAVALLPAGQLFDVVICTGAMELFADPAAAVVNISKLMMVNDDDDGSPAELWLSFQLVDTSTRHQNIQGVTEQEVSSMMTAAGLEIVWSEVCRDAFYTPSPAQDGSMNPVPYLFVVAQRCVGSFL